MGDSEYPEACESCGKKTPSLNVVNSSWVCSECTRSVWDSFVKLQNKLEEIDRRKFVEELRWKKFPVLNDGFVCLVDFMGSDHDIAQAARVSYGEGTKKVSNDEGLIRYLMRHHHTSPFEMAELKFMMRLPMDVNRQLVRHRTASMNEYSTRYSKAIDSMYAVKPEEWRRQSETVKQGSGDCFDVEYGSYFSEKEFAIQTACRETYEDKIERGVARELARKDLPLSTYTEIYWKIDLSNLLKFLKLRMAPDAQYEIRQYANIIGEQIVKPLFPFTYQAFEDFVLNSVTFSAVEMELLKNYMAEVDNTPALYEFEKSRPSEYREMMTKFERLFDV